MIKLNIQRFNSTNKTTHYELSQYVSSDLPTYLVDYNSDMSKIDTGINTAKTTADTASTAATNAQTTAETAQTTANTAVTNAATAQTTANNVNTKVGELASLVTTDKSSIIAAINEVKGNTNTNASGISTLDTEVSGLEGVVLFESSEPNGTAGSIVLSQALSNFDEFEVIYGGNLAGFDIKVERFSTESTNISLFRTNIVSGNLYLYATEYTITGTNFNVSAYARGPINNIAYDSNFNYVKKIIGYKYNW